MSLQLAGKCFGIISDMWLGFYFVYCKVCLFSAVHYCCIIRNLKCFRRFVVPRVLGGHINPAAAPEVSTDAYFPALNRLSTEVFQLCKEWISCNECDCLIGGGRRGARRTQESRRICA